MACIAFAGAGEFHAEAVTVRPVECAQIFNTATRCVEDRTREGDEGRAHINIQRLGGVRGGQFRTYVLNGMIDLIARAFQQREKWLLGKLITAIGLADDFGHIGREP